MLRLVAASRASGAYLRQAVHPACGALKFGEAAGEWIKDICKAVSGGDDNGGDGGDDGGGDDSA